MRSGDYVTESGRRVEVDADDVVVAKQRRTGVRVATGTLVLGAAALLLAVGGVALWLYIDSRLSAGDEDPAAVVGDTVAYDDTANPLELDGPTALGMPLARPGRTAVLVFGPRPDPGDFTQAIDVLSRSLARPLSSGDGEAVELVVLGANAGGVTPLTPGMVELSDFKPDDARQRAGDATLGGGDLAVAVAEAFDEEPDRLVLIVVGGLSSDATNPITQTLDARAGDKLVDAVLVGDSPALADWVADRGGRVRLLFAFDLEDWLAAAP